MQDSSDARTHFLKVIVLIATCASSIPTYAGDKVRADPSADVELAEVTVTARRREESLTDTPVAVTAISGTELEAHGVDRLDQIAGQVPNMTFQPAAPTGGGSTTPSIFIRGVGSSETSLGTEPGIGLYIDDVFIARSVGSVVDLADISSVQVLRGPQGTLFGRNNIGGAIVIRSTPLSDRFDGSVRLATGSLNRREIRASVDIPLGGQFRTRISGISSYRDGYVENVDSNRSKDNFGQTNRNGAAVTLEWLPQDNLTFTLRGDYTKARQTAPPSALIGLVPTVPGSNTPSMIQSLSNLNGTCFGASVLGNSGNPDCIDQQWILGPYKSHDGYKNANPIFDSQGSEPFSNRSRSEIGGASLTAVWSVVDSLTLKSITAYRHIDAFWPSNSDHSPNPGIETKVDFRQHQFTQELQLLGEKGRFNYILGGYYLDEGGSELNVVAFPAVIFRSGGGYGTSSSAIFAQVSFEAADSLELTAGGRYTHEKKTFDTLSNQEIIGVLLDPFTRTFLDFRNNPIPFVTGATPPLSTDEFTPYLSVKYRVTPQLMAYVSYSDGYKSGGYEQRLAPGTQQVPTFTPEHLKMVEIGAKGTFFDRRIIASAALFHSRYDDMQITVVDGVAPTMTNAGDATIKGAELELSWVPTSALTLGTNFGWTDASYDKLSQRALNSGITLNNRLPNLPKVQAGATAQYRIPLGSRLKLTPRVDWSYSSELFVEASNAFLLRQGSVSLFNAGLSLGDTKDRWTLALSGRNLTDKAVLVAGLAQYSIGEIEGTYAAPRTWDLTLRVNF